MAGVLTVALATAPLVGAVAMAHAAAASPASTSVLRLGPPTTVRPDGAGSVALSSVSCPSPARCVAVGTDAGGHAVSASGDESAGRWAWSAALLGASRVGGESLMGVSCQSATACVAVGGDALGQAEATSGVLTDSTWRWATPSVLAPDASGGGALAAVSCPLRTTCVAVGKDAADQGIVMIGTGSGAAWSWTRPAVVPAGPTGSSALTSVSCPTATSCVGVGSDGAGEAVFTVGSSNGTTWVWSTAAALGPSHDALDGVSCVPEGWCVAVGNVGAGSATYQVGRRSAGGWSWGTSQALGTGTVAGVACGTALLCVAVGTTTDGARSVGTYEVAHAARGLPSFTGAQVLVPSAPPTVALDAVACATVDSCTAVGATSTGGAVAVGSKAAPSPVRAVHVRAQDAGALVSWRAPVFDGGARIVSYRAVASPGGASCSVLALRSVPAHCVVAPLVNGARYRLSITADNGIGLSPAPRPPITVVPTQFQPQVPSPLTGALLDFVASRTDVTSVAVYDVSSGQTWRLDPGSVQHTASVAKVEILAMLLYDEQRTHTTMDAATRALATEMIEDSDNDAAQELYVTVGQEPGLAAFDALVGLTGTTADWAWGYTDTTSLDQTRLVRLFAVPNKILSDASRAFGLLLLRHVAPEQAWGVSSGPGRGSSVALKNGWYPTEPSDWQVNSVGWIDGDGRNYVLAVLTKGNATFGYGVATIETISTMVWQGLARRVAPARTRS
jgi:hypothetical protein